MIRAAPSPSPHFVFRSPEGKIVVAQMNEWARYKDTHEHIATIEPRAWIEHRYGDEELLRQALEALEYHRAHWPVQKTDGVIAALRERLT